MLLLRKLLPLFALVASVCLEQVHSHHKPQAILPIPDPLILSDSESESLFPGPFSDRTHVVTLAFTEEVPGNAIFIKGEPLLPAHNYRAGSSGLMGGAFGQSSGTVNGGAPSSISSWWSSTTANITSGSRNGANPSRLVAADVLEDGIAHRANLTDERSHSSPRVDRHSCFISYSAADEAFVTMLVADLRKNGVKCWFAPDDLSIGETTRPAIAKAIKAHDKLLVVLSHHAVRSPWVESEIELALVEERRRNVKVIFPIRLDGDIATDIEGWAGDIHRMRSMGDLTGWKDPSKYQKGLIKILRDLVKA